jgi:hypothetical protein
MSARYVRVLLPTSGCHQCIDVKAHRCSSTYVHFIRYPTGSSRCKAACSPSIHPNPFLNLKLQITLPMPAKSTRRPRRPKQQKTYSDNVRLALQPRPSQLINVSQLQGGASINKGTVDAGSGYSFTLSSLPDASAFSLFDMYRINFVEIEYLLNQTSSTVLYPTLYWTPDYDDASVPTSLAAVQSYESAEVFQYSGTATSFRRKLVPKPAQTAYVGGLATGYVVGSPRTWINTDSPGVQYFGMKHWIQNYNTTTANSTNIIIVVRYNLSFKMVK